MGWPTRDVTVQNNLWLQLRISSVGQICFSFVILSSTFLRVYLSFFFQTSTKPPDLTASPRQLEKCDNSAAPKRKPNPPPKHQLICSPVFAGSVLRDKKKKKKPDNRFTMEPVCRLPTWRCATQLQPLVCMVRRSKKAG